MYPWVQQTIILKSLNPYAPEGLPACFPHLVFPSAGHWERVAAGLGLSQSCQGAGRKLWWAGSDLGHRCSSPSVFHADLGVIDFGLSPGFF